MIRKPMSQTVIVNDTPPARINDLLHTVTTHGIEGVEKEWLEKYGFHTGYLYVDARYGRVLAFYESDRVK